MSLRPSNRFCKINTKYVERKPLVSETTGVSDVRPHLSRLDSYPEDQQVKTAEYSHSAELLQGALETPTVPSSSTMGSTLYSSSLDSLHSCDVDCKSPAACIYSSTPNPSVRRRASLLDTSTALFPKTHVSLEPSEDSSLEQRERTLSKSFSAAGALWPSEGFASWRRPRWSDPKGTSKMGSRKPIMVDNHWPAGPVRKMSSFQADYWACAIPDSLPPSPDRQSPRWNPNKEYEDLLDYTYPLRPNHRHARDLEYGMHESSVHDSGIGLDSLSVSPESTTQPKSVPGQERRSAEVRSAHSFRTPLLKKPCQPAPFSHYRLSPVGKVSFADGGSSIGRTLLSRESAQSLSPQCPGLGSSESTNLEKQGWKTKGQDCLARDVSRHGCIVRKGAGGSFLRSTRMLPLQNECCGDEEYLSLPPRLKELEMLAGQLTDLSLKMRGPGQGQLEGDDFPSTSVNRDPSPSDVCGSDGGPWEIDYDSCHVGSSEEHGEEDLLQNQGREDCLSTPTETASPSARNFAGPERPEIGNERGKEDFRRDSLAHHIKIFCCRLEELIGWLHKIAEITDNWTPPEPDVESVKASLRSYLAFKEDLASHQALTEGVLRDGEKLLDSMASSSPVLQRTLGLIAKQSSELESNADRLYESILEALDALDASLRKSCEAQPSAATAESSKWLMSSTL